MAVAPPRPTSTIAERAIEDGLVKPLGEGGFGAVWLWRGPSGEMAVKIVLKKSGKKHRNVNILTQTRTEATTMAVLKHPHIVGLHHFLETETSLYLCLQLCQGGDLLDLINAGGKLPPWIAKVYFRQLMEAVKYMHDAGYIHRDIKCENIFLSGTRQEVFLGDFGLSGTWAPGKTQKLSWGSPHYASPEISTGSSYLGPEVDVWSCGVVLYAMAMAALPFTGPTDADVIEAVSLGEYPPITSCAPARNLVERILVVDGVKRATVDQVLEHPWIASAPVTLQRVSSDPERVSAMAAAYAEKRPPPAARTEAAAGAPSAATTAASGAAGSPPATQTASTPAAKQPAAAHAPAPVGRTAADQERELRIRGSSIIGRKPPAAAAVPMLAPTLAVGAKPAAESPAAAATGAKGATLVLPDSMPPPRPSGSFINRRPQAKAGSGSRLGSRINRRPSLPEGINVGSRVVESQRRTEFQHLGISLRQSRRNLQALKSGNIALPAGGKYQFQVAASSSSRAPASASPSITSAPSASPQPSPAPTAAPPAPPTSQVQQVSWQQALGETLGSKTAATGATSAPVTPKKEKKSKKEKRDSKRGSAEVISAPLKTGSDNGVKKVGEGEKPAAKMGRVRSQSLDDLIIKNNNNSAAAAATEPLTEEEKLLLQIQKEAPHSDQVANLYLNLIRRICADPSLSFSRLPRQRRPSSSTGSGTGKSAAIAAAAPAPPPAASATNLGASMPSLPTMAATTTIDLSSRFVKAAYLLMRKSSSLLGPITAGKYKSRLCCLTVDGAVVCFRGLEEQAAGIAIDTITDLFGCEIIIEPMIDQLWPFILRTAKQTFSFAVQTEEERSSWIVDVLKLRTLPVLIDLLNDAATGRFAATAACMQAVEKPEATGIILSSSAHLQLFHYIEANLPKMEPSVSSALIDAFTAMICKLSLMPDAATKLQFALPLLLRNLADANEKRSALALQTLQNFSSDPACHAEVRRLGGVPRLLEVLSELLENNAQEQGVSLGGAESGSGNRLVLEKDGLVNKLASPQKSFRPTSVALAFSVDQWRELVTHFKEPILGVPVRDRTWRLMNYPCCFVGSQAVDWLIVHKYAKTREDAVGIGARLLSEGEFTHVASLHPFKDAKLFYRFADASAALKARRLHKAVATETARQADTLMDDLLAEFDPLEVAMTVLANCAADVQVQTQLGERVMMSVVPILSSMFLLKQPRLTLPMLQLLDRCCASGLLFDVLKADVSNPQETQTLLAAQIEATKAELAHQRRTGTYRNSRNPKPHITT